MRVSDIMCVLRAFENRHMHPDQLRHFCIPAALEALRRFREGDLELRFQPRLRNKQRRDAEPFWESMSQLGCNFIQASV